jgi:hypothetical protein
MTGIVFMDGTNAGLVLGGAVVDDNPSNTLTWSVVSGPDGYIFGDTNDCVRQAGGSNLLNGLGAVTLSLWVKPADTNTDGGFVTADDAGFNTFALSAKTSASCGNFTNVVEAAIPTTKGVVHRISASNALKPGQWQHLALTWTNGGAPKLYLNGQLDQPLSGFVAASGVPTNCPQFIVGGGAADNPALWSNDAGGTQKSGGRYSTGQASWNGSIDDVRVFQRACSPDEILALADSPVTNHAPVVDAGTCLQRNGRFCLPPHGGRWPDRNVRGRDGDGD